MPCNCGRIKKSKAREMFSQWDNVSLVSSHQDYDKGTIGFISGQPGSMMLVTFDGIEVLTPAEKLKKIA